MWVLGIHPGFSGRTVSDLSHRAISTALMSQFLKAAQQINYASVVPLSENAPNHPSSTRARSADPSLSDYWCSLLGRGVLPRGVR